MENEKLTEKKKQKPIPFHTEGMRWRYGDNTVLVIGPDGSARRAAPKVRQSKKARKLARRGR